MPGFVDIAKEHPLIIGGSVLGLVILIWLMQSGGSTAAPVDNTAAATLAAQTQIATAQISADASQANTAVAAGVANTKTAASLSYGTAVLNGQVAVATSQYDAATSIAATNAHGAVDLATAQGQAAIGLAAVQGFNANELAGTNDAAAVQLAGLGYQSQLDLQNSAGAFALATQSGNLTAAKLSDMTALASQALAESASFGPAAYGSSGSSSTSGMTQQWEPSSGWGWVATPAGVQNLFSSSNSSYSNSGYNVASAGQNAVSNAAASLVANIQSLSPTLSVNTSGVGATPFALQTVGAHG